MIVHGVRGHQLPEELSNEELEVYGIDWEALHEERILQSQRSNNSASEGGSSWIGQSGPPEHLNEVSVNPPSTVLEPPELSVLHDALLPWLDSPDDADIIALWTNALGLVRVTHNNLF
jgi:hypothetical protein